MAEGLAGYAMSTNFVFEVLKMRPKKVILCVDDNEQDLSVLKFLLNTSGYRVLSANSGEEAIGIFAETAVDLVLSASLMRRMNGSELIRYLKQRSPGVPMILFGDLRIMGTLHGADAVLSKMGSSVELLSRIKIMSARKRGPRPGGKIPVSPAAIAESQPAAVVGL